MVPLLIVRNTDNTVAIAKFFGRLTCDDVVEAVEFAFGSQDIEPGLDRIITIDPRAELDELDARALRIVREQILKREGLNNGGSGFRSVLVEQSPDQYFILNLYKAIWEELCFAEVEFHVVSSEQEAWRLLESSPLVPGEDHE